MKAMQVHTLSPGWRTHLMFAAFDGEVVVHGDHIVVRSPLSPGYYWGNFVLWNRLPTDADFGPWMQRFDEAIVRHIPGARHVTFGIDDPSPRFEAPPAFTAAGFEAFETTTLTLQRPALVPPSQPLAACFELRPLDLAVEAPLVVDLSAACNDDGFEPTGYRAFRAAQMARYGVMAAAGMGHWWGAVHEGKVVAALGLFGEKGSGGPGSLGRFQHVETHPAYRRRGLCRALVHAACRHGFEERGWHTLVMGADPHDVAIRIYRSVGFEPLDRLWMLERRPPEDRVPS